MNKLTRRDFLKLSSMALGGLAMTPFLPDKVDFDDSSLLRIATASMSVYSRPSDKSRIVSQWYRDELVHYYDLVKADEPEHNPYWYRVWGGYLHRSRLHRVKVLYNKPLEYIPEGERQLAEITVPYSQAMRYSKAYGWQPNLRLYYSTVHWITAVEEGPDGEPWYRIFDELVGFPYHVPAMHMRPILAEELAPISPDVPWENKRIEVNLTTQKAYAFEYEKKVFEATISSGILTRDSNTPRGAFYIDPKTPSKHMGEGSLFADIEDYDLPGVPWTSFFTEAGHAFHGTYWHENFGTPMSHGCINMRNEDAKWLYRWVRPVTDLTQVYNKGFGTKVEIHY
ncbi:MAG: L,D-transpeptidase family protein [Anaerolineales bacterium]|nr:L,D-transpeptidase family protein [Anaerolineales bacterium]